MTTATLPTAEQLEAHRTELRGYCYRMLGSAFDADDAVQETLVKAWQGLERFEGRASARSWLYRIATNVCLDALRSRTRRALPMDLAAPAPASAPLGDPLPETTWLEPVPDGDVVPADGDPAQRAVLHDSVRLAFVAALQRLPPRQRVVLVLREVLCWTAAEVAELLDTSVASVNSALQRARASTGDLTSETYRAAPLGEADRVLLDRYLAAFEAYDVPRLVALLREDAGFSMPPFALWLRGTEDIAAFYVGTGAGCEGSRLVPIDANGSPAFAHYKPAPDGGWLPWAIQVLEVSEGRVTHLHHFLAPRLFARFGLPDRLPPED